MDENDPIIVPRFFISKLKSLLMGLDVLLTEIEIHNIHVTSDEEIR